MPGLPVLRNLQEFAQTHVHRASDAIQPRASTAVQPSHSLSSPSPSALNLSQEQGLFQLVSSSHEVVKVLGASVSASVLPMTIPTMNYYLAMKRNDSSTILCNQLTKGLQDSRHIYT